MTSSGVSILNRMNRETEIIRMGRNHAKQIAKSENITLGFGSIEKSSFLIFILITYIVYIVQL